jgi:hypothetical protein
MRVPLQFEIPNDPIAQQLVAQLPRSLVSADLREEFPDISGLSSRNLLSMSLFAAAFPDGSITKQAVSQLPWGHIIRLIQMVKELDDNITAKSEMIEKQLRI